MPDTFSFTNSLSQIVLRDNKLHDIPSDALKNLHSLKVLQLERNNIQNCTFGEEFLNLTKLKMIDISYNPLHVLHNFSFVNLHNAPHLGTFVFSSCKIREIEADAFRRLRSLQYLKLDFNHLNASVLEWGFYGLREASNLTDLSLRGANLKDYEKQTFQYLINTSLINLRADSSRMGVVKTNGFRCLPKLRLLSLTNSQIIKVQSYAFENYSHLKTLILDNNRLSFPPYTAMVKKLFLKNSIKFPLSASDKALQSYGNMKTLVLSGNVIPGIKKRAFGRMNSLQHLDLSNNIISSLDTDAFV